MALPDWIAAWPGLRISLERAELAKRDALFAPFSGRLHAVLAWTDPEERQITWVGEGTRARWGVGIPEIHRQAGKNLDVLLQRTPFGVEELGGRPLGLFDTDSPFKASLLLAPSLRRAVEGPLGWPVWACAPCRDFLFVLRAGDEAAVEVIAEIVAREYEASEMALSTEVLLVHDEGWGVVGDIRPQEPA